MPTPRPHAADVRDADWQPPLTTWLLAGNEPGHPVSYSNVQMKVPVVLFIAQRRQHLAASMPFDDRFRNNLDNLQQVGSRSSIQLQQGTHVLLWHHDDVLSPETRDWWPKCQHVLGVDHHVDLDPAGYDLVAIPIRLVHARTLRASPRRHPVPSILHVHRRVEHQLLLVPLLLLLSVDQRPAFRADASALRISAGFGRMPSPR